ncbi:hypothetical protein PSACC_02352 [Paramicrosporidium saccamoebae]|uniref:Uncharacterized protein n=1 Tax=Paramicrosporidium saccamoebae TaxID=1246581 RepID=A0A2H9TJC0_9FUNG|nr:hypothetical protein PSACC_02352 [Paramicrosporidium saccamoebae]
MKVPLRMFLFLPFVLGGMSTEQQTHDAILQLSNGLDSGRSTWDAFVAAHPNIKDANANSQLCLTLSKLSRETLESGMVQLMLSELPLFTRPERQLKCIVQPPPLEAGEIAQYMSFLKNLPILQDPTLWEHVLKSWESIPESVGKIALLNTSPGLSSSTSERHLVGQFCALEKVQESVQSDLMAILPVFTQPEGAAVLLQAKKGDICALQKGSHQAAIYRKIIQEAADLVSLVPSFEPVLPEPGLNGSLGGCLHIDGFFKMVQYHVSTMNHLMLYKLIDTSSLSLLEVRPTDVIMVGSLLATDAIPVDFFKLFMERAGKTLAVNHQEYRQFLTEVLIFAKETFSCKVFSNWYMTLTLMERSLVGNSEVSIPIWDALLDLNGTDIASLTASLDGVVNLQLLETVLERTKCLTEAPIVLPSSCGALKGLVGSLSVSGIKMLRGSLWRLASLVIRDRADLNKYLSKDKLSVPATAWVFSQLDRQNDVFALELFSMLRHVVTSSTVRAYLSLNEALVTAKNKDLCRNSGKMPRRVSAKVLRAALDHASEDERLQLGPEERNMVIKALISSITGTHPDELDVFVVGDQAPEDVFNYFVNGYCQRWEGAVPGFLAN